MLPSRVEEHSTLKPAEPISERALSRALRNNHVDEKLFGCEPFTYSRGATPEQIAEELDGFIKTRDVEPATGYTRRWISELIARGGFPPPNVLGRLGSAHRWRRSTIRRYLDSLSQYSSSS